VNNESPSNTISHSFRLHRNNTPYDEEGYDYDGYDKMGFDRNKLFLGKEKYDESGYDADGFNKRGYDRLEFKRNGYNAEGFDRNGIDINGYHRSEYDYRMFRQDGTHKNGTLYNDEGYDINGYNADGFNAWGYDSEGYNRNGVDRNGVSRKTKKKNRYRGLQFRKRLKRFSYFSMIMLIFGTFFVPGFIVEGLEAGDLVGKIYVGTEWVGAHYETSGFYADAAGGKHAPNNVFVPDGSPPRLIPGHYEKQYETDPVWTYGIYGAYIAIFGLGWLLSDLIRRRDYVKGCRYNGEKIEKHRWD
jgi:hypothetical protein